MSNDKLVVTAPSLGFSWQSVAQFAAKAIIVAVAVTFSLLILIDNLVSDLDEMIDGRVAVLSKELHSLAIKSNGRLFWENIEHALDQAADPKNEIPQERQEKLLNDVRVLVARARPFILQAEAGLAVTPSSVSQRTK